MEDIKKIIKEKEEKLKINKKIKETNNINEKKQLLKDKSKIINDKIELSEILIKCNNTNKQCENLFKENNNKPLKTKTDKYPEEKNSGKENSVKEEIVGIN